MKLSLSIYTLSFHLVLLLFGSSLFFNASAQSVTPYEQLIYQDKQESILSYLADDMTCGRASGTIGSALAEQFIVDKFRLYGLNPYNWSYTQSFRYEDSISIRNVVGVIPAIEHSDEYIVISAHYDHIGQLHGTIYNGADDNASGVTALLNIAEMYAAMRRDGVGPKKNLIFVAFDGKELSMAGSEYFVKHLFFPRKKIVCDINIDMLGTDLVPMNFDKEYLIVLGEESLPEQYRGYLTYLCRLQRYKLDLDLTFYGSKDFTKMYYGMSDQNSFTKAGIPSLLFTSAFHQYTYRPTDDPVIINYPLLRKRTMLIFNFIDRLCRK